MLWSIPLARRQQLQYIEDIQKKKILGLFQQDDIINKNKISPLGSINQQNLFGYEAYVSLMHLAKPTGAWGSSAKQRDRLAIILQ